MLWVRRLRLFSQPSQSARRIRARLHDTTSFDFLVTNPQDGEVPGIFNVITTLARYVPIFFGGMLIIESTILLKGVRWYHRLAVAAIGILVLYLGIRMLMHDSN